MVQQIETRAQLIWLDDEGIVRAESKLQVELNLADAQEVISTIAAVSRGMRRPMLADLTGLKSMSRDARAYFAGPETASVQSAAALLISSPMARAIGNFFMGLNKALVPARLFTSKPLALEWLRSYLP